MLSLTTLIIRGMIILEVTNMSIRISTKQVHDNLENTMRSNGELEDGEALSLYRVAKDTGLQWRTVRDLYEGSTRSVFSETLETLCKYYRCEPADIIAYVEDETVGNKIDNPNTLPVPIG